MAQEQPTPASSAEPSSLLPERPRFSWPMRIFLFVVVFNMIFRSHTVLVSWGAWMEELEMEELPTRLPTRGELKELATRASEVNPHPIRDKFLESGESTLAFLNPWPSGKTREKLDSTDAWTRYSFAWLSSRFNFVETLLGINQEWPMFSPNVSKRKWITRSRLIYEDSSVQIVRQTADPVDLTNYSHWFQEKVLDYELQVREGRGRVDDCRGYCNLLTHRYPKNAKGSPLVRIELFQVKYNYCPPTEPDPLAFYQAQNGPPESQVWPTYFVYDVATKKGRMID